MCADHVGTKHAETLKCLRLSTPAPHAGLSVSRFISKAFISMESKPCGISHWGRDSPVWNICVDHYMAVLMTAWEYFELKGRTTHSDPEKTLNPNLMKKQHILGGRRPLEKQVTIAQDYIRRKLTEHETEFAPNHILTNNRVPPRPHHGPLDRC